MHVLIIVSDSPVIHQHPKNQSTDSGYPSVFTCSAKGFPRPSINWYTQNGSEVFPLQGTMNEISVNFTGTEDVTSQLTVPITVRADSTDYVCIASNAVGSSSSNPAYLTVVGTFSLITYVCGDTSLFTG